MTFSGELPWRYYQARQHRSIERIEGSRTKDSADSTGSPILSLGCVLYLLCVPSVPPSE